MEPRRNDIVSEATLEASLKINCISPDPGRFLQSAIQWLQDKYQDLHMEYHVDCGWQVSSCFLNGEWDCWFSSEDGSLEGALSEMIMKGESNAN